MALLSTDGVCFRRTPEGDLKFPLELARGLEAVAIGIRSRLLLFAGEWFLNTLVGMRWLPSVDGVTIPERAAILGQHFDPLKLKTEFRREIMTTPGVVGVPFITSTFGGETRTADVSWVARTVFGDTPLDRISRSF